MVGYHATNSELRSKNNDGLAQTPERCKKSAPRAGGRSLPLSLIILLVIIVIFFFCSILICLLLLQVFELLDTQNKGVIGPEELQEVVQQDGMVLENAQEDVMQLLQGIDIDGSNSLNYREFLAATMEASRGP